MLNVYCVEHFTTFFSVIYYPQPFDKKSALVYIVKLVTFKKFHLYIHFYTNEGEN